MRRLSTVLLILIIVGTFGFSFLRYQANQAEADNWFNLHWRSAFAQHTWLQTAFGLHRDGDGKAKFLRSKPMELIIFIHLPPDMALSQSLQDQLLLTIQDIVRKPNHVRFIPGNPLPPEAQAAMTVHDIRQLAAQPEYQSKEKDAADLHLFFLSQSADAPTNVGMTVRENGIVIFQDTIASIAHGDPYVIDAYILSTILHEFGHQLGLQHLDDAQCIMAAAVEEPAPLDGRRIATPTQFCPEELHLIEEQRAQL